MKRHGGEGTKSTCWTLLTAWRVLLQGAQASADDLRLASRWYLGPTIVDPEFDSAVEVYWTKPIYLTINFRYSDS
jgi:hypothetical protein